MASKRKSFFFGSLIFKVVLSKDRKRMVWEGWEVREGWKGGKNSGLGMV